MNNTVQIIECPRDAMQGWPLQIPTPDKIEYLNSLLRCGFHSLDFGSFVSPKAIPQMADTIQVLESLDISDSGTRLLAIIANLRGAEEASRFDQIRYLGFPFSVSPTFQQKNTNSSVEESYQRVAAIQELCIKQNKSLVIYLSMAFGNPYGDTYSKELVVHWAKKIRELGIDIISLADTVGLATVEQVSDLTSTCIDTIRDCTFGVHLHSTPDNWKEKLEAAWNAGCRRFDGALKGIGGCPMAGNVLVGNMNTEWMLDFFAEKGIETSIKQDALKISSEIAGRIFL